MDPTQDPSNNFEVNKSYLARNVILVSIFIIVALIVVELFLVFNNLNNAVKKSISALSPAKQASVALTKEYNNPFDKSIQYSNPFSASQNPFDNLTQ